MALSVCLPLSTDGLGREMTVHGTPPFPVACYHDDLEQMGVPWHWHEELEVLLVEVGTARVRVSGGEYILRRGRGSSSTPASSTGSGPWSPANAASTPSSSTTAWLGAV